MHLHPSSISSSSLVSGVRARDLIGAVILGVVFYVFVFGCVVFRPLTTDVIGMYVDYKVHYLASVRETPKITIFAGSNGRYSHRCETISELTGIVCANLSSAGGYDLKWQMDHYWPYLGKGDVLYMPIEYWPLWAQGAKVGNEAPYVVRHEHAALSRYRLPQLLSALFYFDARYFFSSIGEMLLHRAGVQRARISELDMTTQGDVLGANEAKAMPHRAYLESMAPLSVDPRAYDDVETTAEINSIIDSAKSKGMIVVGGLPTTFADAIVPDTVIERLRTLYEERGACFLVLPNLSRYPRSAFFDTHYHLKEAAQIVNSIAVAPRLAKIFRRGACQ